MLLKFRPEIRHTHKETKELTEFSNRTKGTEERTNIPTNKGIYEQTKKGTNSKNNNAKSKELKLQPRFFAWFHCFSSIQLKLNSSTSICSRGIFTVPNHDVIDSSLAKLKTNISSTVQISSTTRQKRNNML